MPVGSELHSTRTLYATSYALAVARARGARGLLRVASHFKKHRLTAAYMEASVFRALSK